MIPVPVRGFTNRVGSVGLAVLLGLGLLLPTGAAAQQGPQPLQADPYGRPHPDDLNRPVATGFDLFGAADLAWIGTRGRGTMRHSFTNDGPIDYYFVGSSSIVTELNSPNGQSQIFFEGTLWAGTPRSEWNKARQLVPELDNVTGGGWNSHWNLNAWFLRYPNMWRPDDTQLGFVHSGASATNDGACTDFGNDFVNTGSPLMASSDCEDTWGSDQFAGASRLIEFTSWEAYFNAVGPTNFTWDWWRVPPEYVSDELIGDWQTYGKIVDWAADNMARFGNAMPGGMGAPQEQGFPLGLSLVFDAYSFANPDVANVTYWRAMVINESEQAYGVPLDYDSLYLGNQHGILMSAQNPAVYYRPELGGVFFNNNGTNANCNDPRIPAGVASCYTGSNRGFNRGGAAIMVLNSPFGDLRNKQFSDPNSPFFAPGHPLAGDTITFNHGRACGFGSSCWSSTTARSNRAGFGLHASIPVDVFDGRSEAEYDAISGWWYTFRNHDFPNRTPSFNEWPIDWDGDGTVDTLYLDSCLGEEYGGPPGGGCSELWSDTLPGKLNNREGNFGGYIGSGPFALAAGDTTRYTIAVVTGGSRAAIETNARNAVSFYQNAYLGPESAPPPNIVSVAATPGDRGGTPAASIQLFWDDSSEQWEDIFLLLAAGQFEGDPDNPWLADSIRAVARNNLQRIHIFKSCDGGNNFTANTNCDGDEAVDDLGNPVGLGWQPYVTFEADENGNFPNVFADAATTPGKSYLYTIVTETRGFSANIVIRDDQGNPVATELVLAPKLYSVLSTSTSDANVASVYTPASRQAGGEPAEVIFTQDDPRNPVEYHPVVIALTSDIDQSADYELAFGDSVVVTQVLDPVTGEATSSTVDLYRTVVTSLDGGVTLERVAYEEESFSTENPAGVQTNGGVTSDVEVGGVITRTTVYADELTLVTLRANGEPLFVSSALDGSNTTPGTFFGRPDFPRFIVNVDNSQAGSFNGTTWLEEVMTDSLVPLRGTGSPSVSWLDEEATSTGEAFNEYVIDFDDFEFGPQRLFTLNLSNPQQTEDQFVASLEARRVADVTDTSQEVADALGVTVDDLLAVNLPFTMQHNSPDRPVIVAMLSSESAGQTTKLSSVRLGNDVDALDVMVPADQWVPGDRLVLLERVTQFQRAVGDAGEYVVTQNGQPVEVDTLVVTWESAMIGCPDRPACNPLRANTRGADQSSHLPVSPDVQFLRARYVSPITPRTGYAYQVTETLRGNEVEDVTAEDLEEIRVVPNPYVVFSTYEQQIGDRRLLFTGLPPQGKIEIYTVAGQFVQRISWDQEDLAGNGDLYWNMRTRENTEIQSGLYVFYVTGELPASGKTVNKLGKFVVIR